MFNEIHLTDLKIASVFYLNTRANSHIQTSDHHTEKYFNWFQNVLFPNFHIFHSNSIFAISNNENFKLVAMANDGIKNNNKSA